MAKAIKEKAIKERAGKNNENFLSKERLQIYLKL